MFHNPFHNSPHEQNISPRDQREPVHATNGSRSTRPTGAGPRTKFGDTTGSILIWSVLLGFVLTSVFFFFGLRQRANIMVQRDTIAILNARNYLESYADYLEVNPSEISTPFDTDIEVNLTREVEEIEGMVDLEQEISHTFEGGIFVEWNNCADTLKGNLAIDHDNNPSTEDDVYEAISGGCPNEEYDDVAGPITVTNPFSIKTQTNPFRYRIVPEDQNTTLLDNEWHLELSKDLDYGRMVTIERTFINLVP